jgi:hypothetical protein
METQQLLAYFLSFQTFFSCQIDEKIQKSQYFKRKFDLISGIFILKIIN